MACSICSLPDADRETVDRELAELGLRPCARLHPDLTKHALHRHRLTCLGLSGPVPGSEQPEPPHREGPPPHAVEVPALAAVELPSETGAIVLAPEDAATFGDRVRYVAGLVLAQRWTFGVVPQLAAQWSCDERTVRSYAAAAGVALTLDRGSIELQKAASLAATDEIRRTALELEDPDLKAALAAQVHADRVRGLLTPSGPLVQVNVRQVEEHDALDGLLDKLVAALRPHPAALAAAMQVFADAAAERRRVLGVIDVPSEPA